MNNLDAVADVHKRPLPVTNESLSSPVCQDQSSLPRRPTSSSGGAPAFDVEEEKKKRRGEEEKSSASNDGSRLHLLLTANKHR